MSSCDNRTDHMFLALGSRRAIADISAVAFFVSVPLFQAMLLSSDAAVSPVPVYSLGIALGLSNA